MKLIIDGTLIKFTNAKAAVQYLNDTARQPSASIEAYMVDFALRAVMQSGTDIRAHSCECFIEDLIAFGYIEVEN